MTVEQMLDSVARAFHGRKRDSEFMSTFFECCDEAQQEFCFRTWGFARLTDQTLTTADGVRYVALPADFCELLDPNCVRDTTNDTQLEEITEQQWRDRFFDSEDTEGDPSMFWTVPGYMYFDPIPDAALTIKYSYYSGPTAITQASTSFWVPQKYHSLLRYLICRAVIVHGFTSISDKLFTDAASAPMMNNAVSDDIARYGGLEWGLKRNVHRLRVR